MMLATAAFATHYSLPTTHSLSVINFVNPWFVAAGLALPLIPIVIHLLNRRRFRVVTWAAMDFLLRAMKKNRKRLKFEQWILLACRCLLVFLIAFALARPLVGCEKQSLAGSIGGRGRPEGVRIRTLLPPPRP